MDAGTVAERIAELAFMSELPGDTRSQVAGVFLNVSDILHYEDGEALITSGYLSFDTGYVLVDGKATVELPDHAPIEIEAPSLLGEMAQFSTSDMRSATVRAKGGAAAAQFYWKTFIVPRKVSWPKRRTMLFAMPSNGKSGSVSSSRTS